MIAPSMDRFTKLSDKASYQSFGVTGPIRTANDTGDRRRIRTARCIRHFPEVYGLLIEGRLNLSTVSMIAGVIKQPIASELLTRVCDKSQDEVRAVLADYQQPHVVRDLVTPMRAASLGDGENGWQDFYRRRRLSKKLLPGVFVKKVMTPSAGSGCLYLGYRRGSHA